MRISYDRMSRITVPVTKLLLCLLCILSAPAPMEASHGVGGEITYQWISGNNYLVRLNLYRDCSGVPAPATAYVAYGSSLFMGGIITLDLVDSVNITPICTQSLPISTCNGGSLYTIEQMTYEGEVFLAGAASDWIFYFDLCCRNGATTNFVDPDAESLYLSTTLDNLNTPFNNSVQFSAAPVNIIRDSVITNLNWSAYDPDQDSIVFELVGSRGAGGTAMTYVPGFTPEQPFLSVAPTYLDSVTGILKVIPSGQQVALVSMRVSEYRFGVLIAQVYRDAQITVISTSNNLPTLTGINGTPSFTVVGCPGDTIQFNVYGYDNDPGQTVSLYMVQNPPGNALFNTAAQPATGHFSWVPDSSHISSQPYIFSIRADDDHCDYMGTQTNAYSVYVNGCNTSQVWPGDANSDGLANMYDLLAIGLAFNETGPVRPSASLNWIAQLAPNWTNAFLSTINHKHADCDGNGSVNYADTAAIDQNYGLSHPLRLLPFTQSGTADLVVTTVYDTVGINSSIAFDIELSATGGLTDSIYGLAFRFFYNPLYADPSSLAVTFPGSIFGSNGTDMVALHRNFETFGYVDIALSRINHENILCSGPVARITMEPNPGLLSYTTLYVSPMAATANTAMGVPVTLNASGTSVVIDPSLTGENDMQQALSFSLYPVPAQDALHLEFYDAEPPKSIVIADCSGREVLKSTPSDTHLTLDISEIASGIYMLRVYSGTTVTGRKIVVCRNE